MAGRTVACVHSLLLHQHPKRGKDCARCAGSAMTETPDRIWAWYCMPEKQNDVMVGGWDEVPDPKETEYIRADIADAATQAAVVRALEAAAGACRVVRDHPETTDEESTGALVCEQDIRAITTDPAQVARIARGAAE